MHLRARMVDVDGVVIRRPGGQRWDARLAEDLGIDPAATLDAQLLADLADAKTAGLQLHLATVQEPNRARYLWTELKLADHFQAMHYSADIGYSRTDPHFYRVVESRTGLDAGEHCLIDDNLTNVEAARSEGWHARLWTGESRLPDILRA